MPPICLVKTPVAVLLETVPVGLEMAVEVVPLKIPGLKTIGT